MIDRYEIDVDELTLFLLAKAPLVADLRLTAATMRISRDHERIGDEATTIARRALELNQEPPLQSYPELPEIAVEAMQMLNAALADLVQRTVEWAQLVVRQDQGVDGLNTQIHGTLAHWMIERPDTITRCLNLMLISRSIECIADHAVNNHTQASDTGSDEWRRGSGELSFGQSAGDLRRGFVTWLSPACRCKISLPFG